MNEVTPIAEGQAAQEQKEVTTMAEFISQRVEAKLPNLPEEPETQPEKEPTETPEVEKDSIAELAEGTEDVAPEAEVEEEEELESESEFDAWLEKATPEQIQELGKTGHSGLMKRVGKLTAQKRELERKLEQASQTPSEFKPEVKVENNPFSELKADDLQTKHEELTATAEELDRILEENEDAGSDDPIDLGGKEFTKKELRKAARNTRLALTKYLPARFQELQLEAGVEAERGAFQKRIEDELPDALNEETELGKAFANIKENKEFFEAAEKVDKAFAARLPWILAHATRSAMASQRAAEKASAKPAPKSRRPEPPASPSSFGAAPSKPDSGKKLSDAQKQFDETGSAEDFARLRVAQKSLT